MAETTTLPRFALLQSVYTGQYAYFFDETGPNHGFVRLGDRSVFDPLSKIEIEPAKIKKYVHLRFYHTNKYWGCMYDTMVFASLDKPEEDTSNPSCTLFEPKIIDKKLYLIHVQSKRAVRTSPGRLHLDDDAVIDDRSDHPFLDEKYGFNYVDCDHIVKLPKFVAFKGDNGKFLKSVWLDYKPYLQFSSDDQNQKETAHQVEMLSDGHVAIKSVYFNKYWSLSPNWIWGDASNEYDVGARFWPVKLSDGKIALRSARNDNFCQRLTLEGKTSCLNAAASAAGKEARMELHELVDERSISNIRLRLDLARLYDEVPIFGGTTGGINDKSDKDMEVDVKVIFSKTSSHSFSKSLSISTAITTGVEATFFTAVKANFELSVSVAGAFTWEETKSESTSVEVAGKVSVPPNTKAYVRCMGTVGKCSVPFTYTQRDKRAADGTTDVTHQTDGIFTGVTSYNFTFHVTGTEPLRGSMLQ